MSSSADLDNDDDYVAKLLVDDARKSSVRYASQGLSALLPQRPTAPWPKPNTRFLKTLVREADSHNAKLKEKEELEARIRLRRIVGAGPATRNPKRDRDNEGHKRERKRRRLSDDAEDAQSPQRDRRDRARVSRHSQSPEQRGKRDDEHRRRRRRHRQKSDESNEDHDYRRSRLDRSPRRSRSHSRTRSRSRERKEHRETRKRDRHERKSRRLSPPTDTKPEWQKDARDHTRTHMPSRSSSTSSDPLASLIGPHPTSADAEQPPQRRGRGFNHHASHRSRSNIDAHFSPTYNPTTPHDEGLDSDTLNLGDEGGDLDEWTSALSALRDRRAWRAKQAERMKDAGFTDAEIERWEKSSSRTLLGGGSGKDEGDVRDVKWRKKGEEREWDIGKERSPSPSVSGGDMPGPAVVGRAKSPAREGNATRTSSEGKKTARGKGVDSAWRRPESGLLKQFKSALR
ncbi:uncharacterized protein Z520_07167 [Fonsecaea multimorphosa CBS 102226]|uniref:Uncharacterized protein n=1 Tax=Fonsecaea multimorphosa CBS 102226 TaxID=1442371 RepID=A0A0D2KK99_9EURO|nr:uncharacterized protein Z520_07167 [Fonsecaea multimorphosa CBS 102226]KIX97053.1 hypothetical protein Z520_07167 [Fonsecaea multimorphosa CBS 102226]OAL22829.1 hypothetical protein AYO22_06737 [Fonsecaea multimorphosa]